MNHTRDKCDHKIVYRNMCVNCGAVLSSNTRESNNHQLFRLAPTHIGIKATQSVWNDFFYVSVIFDCFLFVLYF